jgi:hypothetical protein
LLNVVTPLVIMLSVIKPNAFELSVSMLSVIMLSVCKPSVAYDGCRK